MSIFYTDSGSFGNLQVATTFDIAWTATGTPGARTYLWEAE